MGFQRVEPVGRSHLVEALGCDDRAHRAFARELRLDGVEAERAGATFDDATSQGRRAVVDEPQGRVLSALLVARDARAVGGELDVARVPAARVLEHGHHAVERRVRAQRVERGRVVERQIAVAVGHQHVVVEQALARGERDGASGAEPRVTLVDVAHAQAEGRAVADERANRVAQVADRDDHVVVRARGEPLELPRGERSAGHRQEVLRDVSRQREHPRREPTREDERLPRHAIRSLAWWPCSAREDGFIPTCLLHARRGCNRSLS